jgi:iron transport multicopper oxidase
MKDQCAMMNVPSSGNAGGLSGSKIYDLSTAPHGPFPQVSGFHARGILSIAACIISSLIGVLTIVWYSRGEQFDDEEVEREILEKIKSKTSQDHPNGLVARFRRFMILRGAP